MPNAAAPKLTAASAISTKLSGVSARSAPKLRERNCSVARTVALLSDAWSFLVIREAFFGARRFESFRIALGLPRATLTERLKRLTKAGIFRQLRYSKTSSRVEYRLTEAGLGLYPSFLAMMQFGDRWLAGSKAPPLRLIHETCGNECRPIVACSSCLEMISARQVSYRDGPGAGVSTIRRPRRARRSDASRFSRGRPSSVSRTLEIIGDRWTFLIVREAFFGTQRFEGLQSELNIASNILTDRLNRLITTGIFERRLYRTLPNRFEYRLTDMGMDLYGALITMMAWGDRWLSNNKPPMVLTHRVCGHDFTPVVICNRCRQPIQAPTMRYKLNYDPQVFGAPVLSDRAAAIGTK